MASVSRAKGGWLVCLVLLAPLGACATGGGPYTWAKEVPLPQPAREAPIQPRDTILVHAASQKDVSGEFPVREDGSYVQPPLGPITAAGLTPAQLVNVLKAKFEGIIVTPQITVSIPKRAPIRVNVIGEVKTPASYELERDRTVGAALAAAGGLNDFADEDGIYVVRVKESPPRIRFKLRDLKSAEPHSALFELRDSDTLVVE